MKTQKVTAIVLQANGVGVQLPIQAELSYRETDPLAVTIRFYEDGMGEVIWVVGRELLEHGCSALWVPYGQGDVRFRYEGPASNAVVGCFSSSDGHADIAFRQDELLRFLRETADSFAKGICNLDHELERAIEALLGEEGS